MEKPQPQSTTGTTGTTGVGSKKGTGSVKPMQVTNQDMNLIKEMKDKINSKLGVNHESYEIISISGEEMAGTSKFFHLRGKPGNKEYTVTIMVPSGDKSSPTIQECCTGLKPHKEGFSQQEVQH
jgi:hypothetical protein